MLSVQAEPFVLMAALTGFIFLIMGACLVVYKDHLVENSAKFHASTTEQGERYVTQINRILCVIAGIVTSMAGLSVILSRVYTR